MDKKPTAYQKLKNKVSLLSQQLDIVCNEPETSAALGIKMVWKMNRQIENQIMSGTPTNIFENKIKKY